MESTLSISRTELRQEIGHVLGSGRDDTAWSTDQAADIDICLAKGLRQFYFPSRLKDQATTHEWSFLKPLDAITVWPDIAVGTATVTGVYDAGTGLTTLTASAASFYASMVGKVITITDTGSFTVSTFSSSTVVVVSGDATSAAKTFAIASAGSFRLPDDFGGFEGKFSFPAGDLYSGLVVTGEGRIRELTSVDNSSGRPEYAAVRPIASTGAAGQRFELVVYPLPDTAYVLTYRKVILANQLTANNPYPLGGMAHAETILASCLAAAEEHIDETRGVRYQAFIERLEASIHTDSRLKTPDYFGYNGDNSDGGNVVFMPRGGVNLVRYGGTLP
jgi:hypothetical protein